MTSNISEARRRLASKRNFLNTLPPSTQATIGALALQTSVTEVADVYRLEEKEVRDVIKRPAPDVRDRIENAKLKISEVALDRLMGTLGLLTPEFIATAEKPVEVAKIAGSLAKTLAAVQPKEKAENTEHKVIFYVPKSMARNYEVIDIEPTE